MCVHECDRILENRPNCHILKCSGDTIEKNDIFKKLILLHKCIDISLTSHTEKFDVAAFLLCGVIKRFVAPCKMTSGIMKQNHQQINRFVYLGGKSILNGG